MSTRSLALGVRCRHCGSGPGEACLGAAHTQRRRMPLRFSAAHPSRIEDAALARGDSAEAARRLWVSDVAGAVSAYRRLNPRAPDVPVGKPKTPAPAQPPPEGASDRSTGQPGAKTGPSGPAPESP